MTFRKALKDIEALGYRIHAQQRHGESVSYDALDVKRSGTGRLVHGPVGSSQQAMAGLWRLCQLRELG